MRSFIDQESTLASSNKKLVLTFRGIVNLNTFNQPQGHGIAHELFHRDVPAGWGPAGWNPDIQREFMDLQNLCGNSDWNAKRC